MYDGMRRNLDARSAATAQEIRDHRQSKAIVDLMAQWEEAERQWVAQINSRETAEMIRATAFRALASDTNPDAKPADFDFIGDWVAGSDPAVKDFMRDWVRQKILSEDPGGPQAALAGGGKEAAGKRSWTQPKLDHAINREIEKYHELIVGAKGGRKGARKDAKKLFRRNALAKRLGVKAPRMVSLSKPWQELANAIGLPRKSRDSQPPAAKVGLAIALEEKADADDTTVADEAIRRETLRIIEGAIESASSKDSRGVEHRKHFEDIREAFNQGTMTDDQARETVAELSGR
jgi:hypothetical protein